MTKDIGRDVRPEDLLSRDHEPVYGPEAVDLIAGRTVLITGAGGSIGSELVRQCLALGAARVHKVDVDETALFDLSLEIFGHALFGTDSDIHLQDVTDRRGMSRLVEHTRPDIIFHAAAKKHLPLVQASPGLAVRTNVFGTESVIRAAVEHRVARVVNISTDKAADPTSVLGWSKRLAELVGAYHGTTTTRISSVRFGNVLGSRGSFLPALAHTMARRQPVRITHPEATRYFMTIPEAAGLVIEAARMSTLNEVFVLDMGEPVRILDLVARFAELTGRPMPAVDVTGLRPGEKIHEDLFSGTERHRRSAHPRIRVTAVQRQAALDDTLEGLRLLLAEGSPAEEIVAALARAATDAPVATPRHAPSRPVAPRPAVRARQLPRLRPVPAFAPA